MRPKGRPASTADVPQGRWLRPVANPVVLVLVCQVLIVPLVVWLMVDQFRAVPVALEEAAQFDGLGRIGICLPLVKPGLAVSAILAGIFAWNDLLHASILTPAESARTAPAIVLSYLGGYDVPCPR